MSDPNQATFPIGGDLPVDRIGFGAMRLTRNGLRDAAARDLDTSRAVLRRAAELGVNHIDTADFYRTPDSATGANDLIREALAPYPAGLVIATKVGARDGPRRSRPGRRRRYPPGRGGQPDRARRQPA